MLKWQESKLLELVKLIDALGRFRDSCSTLTKVCVRGLRRQGFLKRAYLVFQIDVGLILGDLFDAESE